MAAKQVTKKTQKNTSDTIIDAYMKQVMESEMFPKSIYKFCKEHNFSEKEFYDSFASFDGIQKEIWNSFFTNSMQLVQKSKGYDSLTNKEKMLTFFYTFFEILTANRSYVLFVLKEHKEIMKNLVQLKGLRKHVKGFASELIAEANEEKSLSFLKQSETVFSEGAWIQTLFLLKFWMDDDSPAFENTDVAIEKSVRAIFDVFETQPLESLLDFGKFLWKEKMA